jgi:hypothetical protein
MEDGIEVKTGLEIKKIRDIAESKKPTFDSYLEGQGVSYPALYENKELLKAEEEAFELELNRLNWANKVLNKILDPQTDFQGISQYDNSSKSYIKTYFPKKSARVKLCNALNIWTEITRTETEILDWGINPQYIEMNGRKILQHPAGKELVERVYAKAYRKVMLKDIKNNKTVEFTCVGLENTATCTDFELANDKHQNYKNNNVNNTAATRALNRVVFDAAGLSGMKFVMSPDGKKLEVFTGTQKGNPVNLGVSAEEADIDREPDKGI